MAKKRKKTRSRYGLQVVTLCISTAMVLILLGMVVLTICTGRNLSSYVKENLTVTVILSPNVSDQEAQALCKKVKSLSHISDINFVSREQALKEGTKELGADPSEFAGENPFTASIELRLHADYANNDSIKHIAEQLKRFHGVADIDYRQDLIDSVNNTLRKIGLVLLVLAALLTIVSFSLINNTIRLSIYSRRFSIHTMKLVGASWGFIRFPFIKGAIGQGLLSAFIALMVLGGGMYGLYCYEPDMTIVIDWQVLAITSASVLLSGVLITTFCAWLSVNKFLRMKAGDLYKI
ncbi:MAG: permease-like cell division protein FtsX [Prevotella sp.]|nr:permease-like cell division protein FtsX [Prevotella sp.]MDD6393122.1 permease-like cell division protein FtsX [Prevotella sp.]MDY2702851.1 permease-like cell division protein FtsX [Prevotella sp.]